MQRNLEITKGLYFSQSILLELTRRGLERKIAYEAVQRAAMAAWNSKEDFLTEVKKVSEITSLISPAELDGLCSLEQHFCYVEQKFKNVGL
jgi:adenylosuccinate lyase